jgi:DNA-binding NtrC family response regulator
MRVLLAEDDVVLADVVREALVEEGYTVTLATTLDRANAAVHSSSCDVVVLDVFHGSYTEPDAEVLAAVRSLGAHTPVILTTGRAWAIGADPDALGVAAVLPKPYDLNDLLSAVHQAAQTLAPSH